MSVSFGYGSMSHRCQSQWAMIWRRGYVVWTSIMPFVNRLPLHLSSISLLVMTRVSTLSSSPPSDRIGGPDGLQLNPRVTARKIHMRPSTVGGEASQVRLVAVGRRHDNFRMTENLRKHHLLCCFNWRNTYRCISRRASWLSLHPRDGGPGGCKKRRTSVGTWTNKNPLT